MIDQGEIRINARLLPQQAYSTAFLFRKYAVLSKKVYVGRVVWDEIDPGAEMPYAFRISEYQGYVLASLMDDLWKDGVRPSGEYHGTAGQLAVAQAHLRDLREIAFHALKMTVTPTPFPPQR